MAEQNTTPISTELLDELYQKLGAALKDMKAIIIAQGAKISELKKGLVTYKNLYENALAQKKEKTGNSKKIQH
jgi:hypothetical protein